MRMNMPGLVKETLRPGAVRWRVRPAGQRGRKITLPVAPDHPRFMEAYHAARAGQTPDIPPAPVEREIPRSLGWLTRAYEAWLEGQVKAGAMSPLTLRQKRGQLAWMRAQEHDGTPLAAMSLAMPRAQVIRLRDALADRPGAADNMVKTISRLYSWAIERDYATANPATGCRLRPKHKGATPWTAEDLRKYRQRHEPGTMAHLALTLLMFTAARRGDVVRLGRGMERERDGLTWLVWTPSKRGSVETWTPMLPPLWRATRTQTVIGPAYLLTAHGRPFASGDAFGNRLAKWCEQAGLEGRSAHGVRKATAELLSEEGATGAQIAAVLGHTNTRTGEVYTRGAERARMARAAMETMRDMAW